MSDQNGELADFPEMDAADVSDALGVEASADSGDEDAAPAGDTDGLDEPAAEPDPGEPSTELPEYRREAIANREKKELQDRIDRLERRLEEQSAPKVEPIAAKPGQTLTPEQQEARERVKAKFYEVWPEAKDLFEKAGQILRAAEVAPGIADQAEAANNHRADSALRTVTDRVAAGILGTGKTGANLRPQARQRIATAFAQWTGVEYLDDESKMPADVRQRAIRYNNGDTTLFDEFAKDFLSDFTPVNRAERVADAKRAAVKSPRGGPASAPPPASPKMPTGDDEDALHNAAFASVRASAAAG